MLHLFHCQAIKKVLFFSHRQIGGNNGSEYGEYQTSQSQTLLRSMTMKGLLRMFTQGDRCTLLAGASGKHVEKFGHFKEFLAGNRNALRALAELEMLYYSGQSFTAADIAFQYEQLFGQVRALVNALNNLSEQRYTLLNQQADAINAQVRRIFRPPVHRQDLPLVVALADVPATAAGDAGGKAANLARIARETDLLVPPGFVVTAGGYDRFLKANHLDQLVLDELAGLSPNDPQLAEVSERLVSLILNADVPEELTALLQTNTRPLHSGPGPASGWPCAAVRCVRIPRPLLPVSTVRCSM
jgi:pyruvate, water dikinase